MRQGTRRGPCPWGLILLLALGPLPARAGTLVAEASASRDFWAWALLGEVELREAETFLTFGYSGARPEPGTSPSHQLSLGVDHGVSTHWLVSGLVNVGLPKATFTPLARELPRLRARAAGRPIAFICRTGRRSAEAVRLAADAGIAEVVNVDGGMSAWAAAGLPLVPAGGRVT